MLRAKEQQDFQQSLSRVKSQVDEAAKKIVHLLQSCSHKEHLSKESSKLPAQIQALCSKAGEYFIYREDIEYIEIVGKTNSFFFFFYKNTYGAVVKI